VFQYALFLKTSYSAIANGITPRHAAVPGFPERGRGTMRNLRGLALGSLAAALLTAYAVNTSYAVEPGDYENYLRGATVGLPLGAAPPPGLYSGLTTLFGVNSYAYGNQALPVAKDFPSVGVGVPLLWSTGWTVFGATYSAAVVQGFYLAYSWDTNAGGPAFGAGQGASLSPEIANTSFTPVRLSWNVGQGWFFAAAFSFVAPDGSSYPSNFAIGGAPDLNPDYWSFEPGWAISYLAKDWTASANFLYVINTASKGTCCGLGSPTPAAPGQGFTTGNVLFVDASVTYKFGKWEIGPIAYVKFQTTADTPGGGIPCTPALCGYEQQINVGGLIGYDFGPVDLQVWAADDVLCRNANCGLDIWTRWSFKIWGPQAKPLIAKN
jgi:hypothetical protein